MRESPTLSDAPFAVPIQSRFGRANLKQKIGRIQEAAQIFGGLDGRGARLVSKREQYRFELAQSLVESNRLYALAAARAGNARLADFLRQLEPVLLSLANQTGTATVQSSEDLRRFLDATDLLFQVRATEARLDRDGKRRT